MAQAGRPLNQHARAWQLAVFLGPALLVYVAFSAWPLLETLRLAFYRAEDSGATVFVGLENFRTILGDADWSASFWNAMRNNALFFAVHMVVQNGIALALAALLSVKGLRFAKGYRTLIFLPTLLSVVIVGFIWQLILSPLWGVGEKLLGSVGLAEWFGPWLGMEETALLTVSFISVWQYVGIPMMLIYAALLAVPEEILEAAHAEGAGPWRIFFAIQLPLIYPTLGLVTILTFVGNFNAFDLVYSIKGALAGPNYATDILGTLFYRTFFGYQAQVGSATMGAAVATLMLLVILCGVGLYFFAVQRRLVRHALSRRDWLLRPDVGRLTVHGVLGLYTGLALFPIALILINSVKTRAAIFANPLALPTMDTLSWVGFQKVLSATNFGLYFGNSLVVTLASLLLIILFGAMAAWALSEYDFRGRAFWGALIAIGIMVPIRLGTVAILQRVAALDLVNTRTALVLVYTAQGLPLAVMILSEFIRQVPGELKDAARCDGVGEFRIFFQVILPLIRPAIATVAVFTMIPAWNDLWFPLILAPGDDTKTVTLGVQQFIGQYVTDWNSVLAALSLAVLPILVLYALFSRQLIRGLTSGAVK